jgi:hypothetical protein
MSPRTGTRPGGVEITPTPVMMESPPLVGSRSFITILSTILGIVVATGLIVGFVGKYFYVDHTEYAAKNLRDTEDRGNVQKILVKVETSMAQQANTLDRQEKAFDRMAETVRAIEIGMARGRK